jgi:uncharacterized lipoprotein YmbA
MIGVRHLTMAACALALAACASAPMHYYTLVAPPSAISAAAIPPAAFQFELLPVGIPAQNDQPQLVVRQGDQGVAVLDGERWIAPLTDEVRGALSANLAHDLNAPDAAGMSSGGKPLLRIKVDVHRFDSWPGSYALLEAAWSIHSTKGAHSIACTSRISETVGPGYDQLVAGHQRALAELAEQIASVAPAVAAGDAPPCPVR